VQDVGPWHALTSLYCLIAEHLGSGLLRTSYRPLWQSMLLIFLFVAQVLTSTAYAAVDRGDGIYEQTFHVHTIKHHHHGMLEVRSKAADEADGPHEHRVHYSAQCTPIAETDWTIPLNIARGVAIRDVVFRSICSPPRYKPPRA